MNIIYNNLKILNDYHHLPIENFKIKKMGKHRTLAVKSFIERIFNKTAANKAVLSLIKNNIQQLNKASNLDLFIDPEKKNVTELFLAALQFNQYILNSENSPKNYKVFSSLGLTVKDLIKNENAPELIPIKIKNIQASVPLKNELHKNQAPYTVLKKDKVLYFYDKSSKGHKAEAARIFNATQRERFLSFIGKIVEAVCSIFKVEVHYFRKYHYFRNAENKQSNLIYRSDSPIIQTNHPTSYWSGHATNFFRIPLKQKNGQKTTFVNIITDPVKGDLSSLLYPRMTKYAAANTVKHIYLLSHNHRDHMEIDAIKDLPLDTIMIVPIGDERKFQELGFTRVFPHNWWEKTTLTFEVDKEEYELDITSVPANHWSGRNGCDSSHANTLGYVVKSEGMEGDIYFAGDTARLSNQHIESLRNEFNIRWIYQPAGPDESRKDMKSTHQSSSDGLSMLFHLSIKKLYLDYQRQGQLKLSDKEKFFEDVKKLKLLYMHMKTFKLGNIHFDDTDRSIERIVQTLLSNKKTKPMKSYEKEVYQELLKLGSEIQFEDKGLTNQEIAHIIQETVIIPKIGELTIL